MSYIKEAQELRHQAITLLLIEREQVAEHLAQRHPRPHKMSVRKKGLADRG
jgi:hypothetical protein